MQRITRLVLVALVAVACAHALPKNRIGGPAVPAVNEFHSVLVLVTRPDIEEGLAGLGGGTIVTRNRVLTAAHVVRAADSVTVGFYSTSFEASRFRTASAEYFLPLQGYAIPTFLNDLAVLSFADNTFPAANVIPVAITLPSVGSAATLASYGFTTATSETPNQFPLLAEHTIDTCTATAVAFTPSHFCAGAPAPAVVCPGDNGSGLFIGEGASKRLIGIVSLVNPGCVVPTGESQTLVGYTNLSLDNIQRFLRSQNVIPSDAAPEVVQLGRRHA